jgi:XRE family transcriptional regulator, regulator of sulfur utilization
VSEDIKKVVGQNIQRLRKKKGWSQEQLVEEAGLHRTYIGQVERGVRDAGKEAVRLCS